MRIILFLFLGFAQLAACQSPTTPTTTKNTPTQVPVYDNFADLAPIFQYDNDTTYLINFWATWCKPCVEELPYIEQLHDDFPDAKLKIILVSMDFPKQIESHLIPFMQERQLRSDVVVLTDGDVNTWIPMVDESWGGAIPVSVLYKGQKRTFIGEAFADHEELLTLVKEYIN